MDLDNMTRDELLEVVINQGYCKLYRPIFDKPAFKVGRYYKLEQVGNNEIEVHSGEKTDYKNIYQHVLFLNFKEADEYFKEN